MKTEMQRPLNEEFIEQVIGAGITFYDQYGTPVGQTKDLGVVAEYLLVTGERHNGPGLGGPRHML